MKKFIHVSILLALLVFVFAGCAIIDTPPAQTTAAEVLEEEDILEETEEDISDEAEEEEVLDKAEGEIPAEEDEEAEITEETTEEIDMEFTVQSENNPLATITMENGDKIIIELFPDIAPNTVSNFIYLVNQGFYDGVIFHRVIPNFMIQGGCPDGTGMGGPGHHIFGEFGSNGFENDLSHTRGVVSMARTPAPNSAGSQFFICVGDPTFLDNEYAGFGKVVFGMETADAIVMQPRNAGDRPHEDQRIQTVTVDTKGIDFPAPEKM